MKSHSITIRPHSTHLMIPESQTRAASAAALWSAHSRTEDRNQASWSLRCDYTDRPIRNSVRITAELKWLTKATRSSLQHSLPNTTKNFSHTLEVHRSMLSEHQFLGQRLILHIFRCGLLFGFKKRNCVRSPPHFLRLQLTSVKFPEVSQHHRAFPTLVSMWSSHTSPPREQVASVYQNNSGKVYLIKMK